MTPYYSPLTENWHRTGSFVRMVTGNVYKIQNNGALDSGVPNVACQILRVPMSRVFVATRNRKVNVKFSLNNL